MKRIVYLAIVMSVAFSTFVFAQGDNRIPSKGYALFSKDGNFTPYEFTRHAVGDNDVLIEILYAGICHSDLHHARAEWRKETYPMVPGHEIAGRVVKVGKNVTKFKVGDYAGVGCLVNSCGECEYCRKGEEQYCDKRVLTYASKDIYHNNEMTQGGYSNNIVVSEKFAIKIPKNARLEKVAPLLCAGITTYSPLKFTHVKKGDKVAIAGFGGLGHMAVQYAVALGAKVTVFDITENKRQDALSMGAVKYVNVRNPEELKGLDNSFRVIISTIPAKYDPAMYLRMLKMDCEMVVLGLPAKENTPSIDIATLIFQGRRKIYGSQIGGIRETQEMLDYSVANNIYPRVEIIPIQRLDEAYKKVLAGEVKFRYVIDMKSLQSAVVSPRKQSEEEMKEQIMSANNLSNSVIFPIGEKFESKNFNGTVWLNMLTPFGSACPIGNVTFEPGCRNSWHKHAGGQILLVTGGRGYYQEWGKPAQELHAGDVVNIPADVKRWHGAAKDSWFVHLAVEVNPEKVPATWLEPVSDEDYNKLK